MRLWSRGLLTPGLDTPELLGTRKMSRILPEQEETIYSQSDILKILVIKAKYLNIMTWWVTQTP